jgi:hypothetical protein
MSAEAALGREDSLMEQPPEDRPDHPQDGDAPTPDSERPPTDKPRLSAPAHRSDDEIAEAIGRMLRALGRRCADGDPDTAHLLRFLLGELDDAFADAVAGWRRSGFSDAQIGRELGVTKQAVQQRWPRQA